MVLALIQKLCWNITGTDSVERELWFIKDKQFDVSEDYLKNENRIAALSMLMVLYLLVFSVAD
jgi:transposase